MSIACRMLLGDSIRPCTMAEVESKHGTSRPRQDFGVARPRQDFVVAKSKRDTRFHISCFSSSQVANLQFVTSLLPEETWLNIIPLYTFILKIEKKVLLSTFKNITKIMFKNIPGFAAPPCTFPLIIVLCLSNSSSLLHFQQWFTA